MQTTQNQNQTLETIPISNNHYNPMPVNTPQVAQPINQANPIYNQNINPTVIINQKQPDVVIKTTKTFISEPIKFGPESMSTSCPFCKEVNPTVVKKNYNIKAILTAIGTCFVGFACLQICNNKEIGCQDSIHTCPKCNHNLGTYYIM